MHLPHVTALKGTPGDFGGSLTCPLTFPSDTVLGFHLRLRPGFREPSSVHPPSPGSHGKPHVKLSWTHSPAKGGRAGCYGESVFPPSCGLLEEEMPPSSCEGTASVPTPSRRAAATAEALGYCLIARRHVCSAEEPARGRGHPSSRGALWDGGSTSSGPRQRLLPFHRRDERPVTLTSFLTRTLA